jgi:hypothetical protein
MQPSGMDRKELDAGGTVTRCHSRATMTVLFRHAMHFHFFAPTPLKSLTVFCSGGIICFSLSIRSCKMMEENSFFRVSNDGSGNEIEELLATISASTNTTLKTLGFQFEDLYFTDDEVNQLVSIL